MCFPSLSLCLYVFNLILQHHSAQPYHAGNEGWLSTLSVF